MKNSILTLVVLIVLTIAVAIISKTSGVYVVGGILVLSALKFIGISFFFMDLRKAHPFWKISVCIYLFVFVSVLLIMK